YAATKWPVIGFLVDIIYEIWASWRLTLTGRPNLKTILAERQKRLECNASNRCSQ
ncbi:MAG: thiol-disulfide oxidoreductase, partial [Microcystis sp.]